MVASMDAIFFNEIGRECSITHEGINSNAITIQLPNDYSYGNGNDKKLENLFRLTNGMGEHMIENKNIINYSDRILITGSNGFIGSRVIEKLVNYGFTELHCFVRPSSNLKALEEIINRSKNNAHIRVFEGNLLRREDCMEATQKVSLVFHLAAGMEKTFAGCYMNSVVTTRNLLDSILENVELKRFINISSLAVYSNAENNGRGILDEKSEIDPRPDLRYEAYAYGKVKQEELLLDYGRRFGIPYVIVRPGDVFGPGKRKISGKIGIDSFGIYLQLGGRNQIPLTYVDNCAEAIVLAGLRKGIDGEIFNIIDDNLPTGSQFLKMYKKNVKKIHSLYLPYRVTYFLSYLWERYAEWSQGQIPPVFNRRRCVAHWKKVKYSNSEIKEQLGWKPKIEMKEALQRYFTFLKSNGNENA